MDYSNYLRAILLVHPEDIDVREVKQNLSSLGPDLSTFLCKNQLTGQSIGFSYIFFEKTVMQEQAIPSSVSIDKKLVRIAVSELEQSCGKPGCIMLSDIVESWNEDSLFQLCSRFGNILHISITDKGKNNLCTAFVYFEQEEAAALCSLKIADEHKIKASLFPEALHIEMTKTRKLSLNSNFPSAVVETILFGSMINTAVTETKCHMQDLILQMKTKNVEALQIQIESLKMSLQQQRLSSLHLINAENIARFNFQDLTKNVENLNMLAKKQLSKQEIYTKGSGPEDLIKIELKFYANGILWQDKTFHSYNDMATKLCIQDLLDGYFPKQLQSQYPRGVFMTVLDQRNLCFSIVQSPLVLNQGLNHPVVPANILMPQMMQYPVMPIQMQRPASCSPPSQTLTAATLSLHDRREHKTILGEHLFPQVAKLSKSKAGKITGILLELDNSELLQLIENPDLLKSRVCNLYPRKFKLSLRIIGNILLEMTPQC